MSNICFSFILAASSLISALRANINEITLQTVSDPEMVETYSVVSSYGLENGIDMRELYLKVPLGDAELSSFMENLNEDGSFSDIDYHDAHRGAWKTSTHAFRVQRMAIRYVQKGDRTCLDAALKAMRYWHLTMPVCPNWWYNEIGIPKMMGPAYLLLLDEMTPSDMEGAVRVMEKASFKQTGQNKVWQAGNVLMRAIIQGDEALARQAGEVIASEIHFADGDEGLQNDWSFHQHGPQLQFGNYGLSFAVSMAWWSRAFRGTDMEFSADRIDLLRSYVRNGLGKVVWNGWFDHNACGRQVFMNAQKGKALCVENAASNLGIELDDSRGGVFFPRSDFGVYRGRGWYASIRMQSAGLRGFETTNNENMKGYFSSDGALLVRRSGDEYRDVSGVWNWKHIPGATTYDNGIELSGSPETVKNGPYFNHSSLVSGKTVGRDMVAWMEYDRDSLKARKAWFFWKGGIVCLGAGISRSAGDDVVTTIDQCRLNGAVTEGKNWVNHNGVTYVILDGSGYVLNNGPHTGSWLPISPTYPAEEVSGDLFEMYLEHGGAPVNASYAYAVVPDGSDGATAARRLARKLKILENSTGRQAIRIGLRRYSVDWTAMD